MNIGIYIALGLFAWLIVAVMYFAWQIDAPRRGVRFSDRLRDVVDFVILLPFLGLVSLIDLVEYASRKARQLKGQR